jgi:hypothetical protein
MQFLMQKIFNKSFLITILRYGLVAAGAWLTATYGFDAGVWETVSGAIIVIALALFGGIESTKDKAVVDGKNVDVAKLSPTVRSELKDAVEAKPERNWFNVFIGK